jgi:outer membrane murein-binding lipoprotein Lpp
MNVDPKAGAVAGCLLACLLVGCSSGLEGVDKRLSALQDEITKLQNQNDRLVERVDAMEVQQAKADRAAKPANSAPAASERPTLKVVKVLPEDDSGMPAPQIGTPAPGDAADDPSPRPLIKLRGGGKGSEKGEGKGEG